MLVRPARDTDHAAFHVALAEAVDTTLLRMDRRFAGAPGPACLIEVLGD